MIFLVILANVFFNESTYSIDENSGQVQFVLFLSKQLSVDLIIQIKDKSNTAIGSYVVMVLCA